MSLNPAVGAMRQYLALIRPWVNEWDSDSIDMRAAQIESDLSTVIFDIPMRPLPGWFEQLLLGRERSAALMLLISWVERFNLANRALMIASEDERYDRARILHGVVGRMGTGTLFDVYQAAEGTVL